MNTRPVPLATLCKLLPACLLFFLGSTTSSLAKTGEQLNWYLHNSWSWPGGVSSITSHIDSASGRVQVYALEYGSNSNEIWVYDLNGSQVRTINIPRMYYGIDIELDENGTLFLVDHYSVMCLENDGTFMWRAGKNVSETSYGTYGSEEREFHFDPWAQNIRTLAISPDGNLYIADHYNDRIQVLNKDGNYLRQFGKKVGQTAAPGDLNKPRQIAINQHGTVIIWDSPIYEQNFGERNYFKTYSFNGEFLGRYNYSSRWSGDYYGGFSIHPSGLIFTNSYSGSGRQDDYNHFEKYGIYSSDFKFLYTMESKAGSARPGEYIFLSDGSGDYVTTSGQYYKSVYRTKGLPEPNSPPHPAVHSIVQRSGTNLIDIDFEIIDVDDDTATVGMIAAVNGNFNNPNQWIIPDALAEGTESKIGQPIATNQTHRVTWSVKGDWSELYGNLQVGLFAQDARRDKPVDIHFLELPLEEGNMTISRSPIKDADIVNYFQFLLATGSAGLALENGQIIDGNGTVLVNASLQTTSSGRKAFIDALGYRWAGIAELAYAREAATPGKTNVWDATNQILPRNLPAKVNEYGFDTGDHGGRAWWVIKDSYLSIPNFTDYAFDNNGSQNQYFGLSVAIAGNKVVVGEEHYYSKLWLYEVEGNGTSLSSPVEIIPTQPEGYYNHDYYFGSYSERIDMDGNYLVVGQTDLDQESPQYKGDVGGAFVFDLSGVGPVQIQTLLMDDPQPYSGFGNSVSISGDLLVVGARSTTFEDHQYAGSAYLYTRGTDGNFSQTAQVMPENSQEDAYFGSSVAVSGEWVAVGASEEDINYGGSERNHAGAVYLYKVSSSGTVTQTDRIVSPRWETDGYDYNFGNRVKLSGNWLAVNSSNNYDVHLYKISTEGKAQLIRSLPHDHSISDIDLDGDRLIVGMGYAYVEGYYGSGSAYIYKLYEDDRTLLLEGLVHPDAKQEDYFGRSVGISGQNIVVGVPNRDLDNYRWDAGGAVFFRSSE